MGPLVNRSQHSKVRGWGTDGCPVSNHAPAVAEPCVQHHGMASAPADHGESTCRAAGVFPLPQYSQAAARGGPRGSNVQGQPSQVLGLIQGAVEEGATLLTGGRRPPHLPRGFFVEPTVFVNVKRHMRIWREEVFGPVLACMTFKTEQEAIDLANESEYGLAGKTHLVGLGSPLSLSYADVALSFCSRRHVRLCGPVPPGRRGDGVWDRLAAVLPARLLPAAMGRRKEQRLRQGPRDLRA